MSTVESIARKDVIEMVPYQSARRLEAGNGDFNSKVWLNANESPGQGSYRVESNCINRYPDFQPANLLQAYSNYSQLPEQQMLATRGADEGIELLIRTFCQAYQDNILICPPTYGMYAISAENHGAGIIRVPLVNQQLDVENIIDKAPNAKVIFLCSPGNPTGNLLSKKDIIAVLEGVCGKAIVVVDEAYIEYSPKDSFASLIEQYENLVVLRTLSKAFGLAGLRCGFTLANAKVIELLSKVIAPYPISAPVAEIASQALQDESLKAMRSRVAISNEQRTQLVDWLLTQPWCEQVFESDANFVLFRTPLREQIFSGLKAQNILIRDQSKQLNLKDCLRISIGSEQELATTKAAIETIIKQEAEN